MADDRYSYNRQLAYDLLKQEGYTDIGDSAEELFKDRGNSELAYQLLSKAGYTDIGKDYNEFAGMLYGPEQEAAKPRPQSRASRFNEMARQRDEARNANRPAMSQREVAAFEDKQAADMRARQQRMAERRAQAQKPEEEVAEEAPEQVEEEPVRSNEEMLAEIASLHEQYDPIISEYERRYDEHKNTLDIGSKKNKENQDWLYAHRDEYRAAKKAVDEAQGRLNLATREDDMERLEAKRKENRSGMPTPQEVVAGRLTPFSRNDKYQDNPERQAAEELYGMAEQTLKQGSKYAPGYEGNALEKIWTAASQFVGGAANNFDKGSLTFGASEGAALKTAREVGEKNNRIVEDTIKSLGYDDEKVDSILKTRDEDVRRLNELTSDLDRENGEIESMQRTYEDMVRRGDPKAASYGKEYKKKVSDYNKRIKDEYQPLFDRYQEDSKEYDTIMSAVGTAVDEGLTDGEKAVLDALEEFTSAKIKRSGDVSVASAAGAGAEQSAEFMLDFILTGGMAKAGTKAAAKLASKNILKRAVGEKGAKIVARGLSDMGVAAARTSVMVPRNLSAYGEQLVQMTGGVDSLGRYQFDRSRLNAALNTALTQYIEYWSEGFGEYFGALEQQAFKRVTNAAPRTAIGKTLSQYRGSIGQYLDKGKFDGMFNEMLEEVVGSGLNALSGWMSNDRVGDKEALKEFASGEQLATLAFSFLPMSVISARTNIKAYNKMKERYDEGVRFLNPFLRSGAIDRQDLDDLVAGISELTPEEIKDAVVVIADKARAANGGRLPDNFTTNLMGYLEGEFAMSLKNDVWESSAENMDVVNSYTQSYYNANPANAYDLAQEEKSAYDSAVEAGFSEDELELDSYMLAQQAASMKEAEPERAQVLMDYATAKASASGLKDGYDRETTEIIKKAEEPILQQADNEGLLIYATAPDGTAVFITSKDATADANGNVSSPTGPDGLVTYIDQDGQSGTAKAKDINDAGYIETDWYLMDLEDKISQQRNALYEQSLSTVSPLGQSRNLAQLKGQNVFVTGSGAYEPVRVERLTNNGQSVVISGDKEALKGIATAAGINSPGGTYLEIPVQSLYPMLAKDDDGALSTDMEIPEATASTQMPESAPQSPAGVEDLVGAETSIVMNGQPTDVFVTEVSDGRVFFDMEDAEGNASHFDMPVAEFERAMNGEEAPVAEPAPAPAPAEEPVQQEEEAVPQNGTIPVNAETGKKIYDDPSVTPEMAYEDLYGNVEQYSKAEENRDKWVIRKSEEADKAVKDAEKLVASGEAKKKAIDNWDIKDNEDLEDLEARQNKAKEKVDAEIGSTQAELPELRRRAAFWNELKEVADANTEARRQQAERQKIIDQYSVDVRGFDLEPRSMEELLARELSDFFRSGQRLSRESVLDLVGHNMVKDLRKGGYAFVLSNDGVPVDKFVMDVDASYPGFIKDEQDAINAVGDLIMGHTRGELADYIFNNRLEEARRLMAEMENEEERAQETEAPAVPETPAEEPQAPAEEPVAEEPVEDLPEDMPEEIAEPEPVAEEAVEEQPETENPAENDDELGENETREIRDAVDAIVSGKDTKRYELNSHNVPVDYTIAGKDVNSYIRDRYDKFKAPLEKKREEIRKEYVAYRERVEEQSKRDILARNPHITEDNPHLPDYVSDEADKRLKGDAKFKELGSQIDALDDQIGNYQSRRYNAVAKIEEIYTKNLPATETPAPKTERNGAENEAPASETKEESVTSQKKEEKKAEEPVAETAQESELTEEEIRNSGYPDEDVIDAAVDYINGERSFSNTSAYNLIKEYVRPQRNATQSTGGSADGTQLDGPVVPPSGVGTERSGGEGGELGGSAQGATSERVPGNQDGGVPSGEGGPAKTAGVGQRTDVPDSGSNVRGGRGESREGGRPNDVVPGRDESAEKPEQPAERTQAGSTDIAALGGELEDLLKQFGATNLSVDRDINGLDSVSYSTEAEQPKEGLLSSKRPKKPTVTLSFDGLNPKQMEIAGKIIFSSAKLGYAYAKTEKLTSFNDFRRWFKSKFGDAVMKGLNYDESSLDAFIGEVWNTKMKIDGKRLTLAEHASDIHNEELRNESGVSISERARRQKAANEKKIPFKAADRNNIAEALPQLTPGQWDDVVAIERQFFDPSHNDYDHAYGKGMMITNGTGTGKTYTGLGTIKRFLDQGKKRILLVAPASMTQEWVDKGKAMGIDMARLENKKDKGEGVVVTSYQNFSDNYALYEDDFDLVVYDECHNILLNQKGEEKTAVTAHKLITNKNVEEAQERLVSVYTEPGRRRNELRAEAKALDKESKDPATTEQRLIEIELRQEAIQGEIDLLTPQINALKPQFRERAEKATKNTKVLMLSATPFNTIENLKYAEGYIFSYPKVFKSDGTEITDEDSRHSAFMNDWFRGDEPMEEREIAFGDHLLDELETVSFRELENGYDHSRDFPDVSGNVMASRFNYAWQSIMRNPRYQPLKQFADTLFKDYVWTTQLFESMKASALRDRIKEHLDAGRKIVIFHDRMHESKDNGKRPPVGPPFQTVLDLAMNGDIPPLTSIMEFKKEFADILKWEAGLDYRPVHEQVIDFFATDADRARYDKEMEEYRKKLDEWQKEYDKFVLTHPTMKPEVIEKKAPKRPKAPSLKAESVATYNGEVTDRGKEDAKAKFNDDNSKVKIICVTTASGGAGLSLHDTTGKYPRVMIQTALPVSPIGFIQAEGRIFRWGNRSNAAFEYPRLGLDIEAIVFAMNFNAKAETVENLAHGFRGRGLKDSIMTGFYENSGNVPIAGQGIGGVEMDRRGNTLKGMAKAKHDYGVAQRKGIKPGDKSIPETVGYVMSNWGNLQSGDQALVPFAGRGSIARYMPKGVITSALEQDVALQADLAVTSGGEDFKMREGSFRELNPINKADVVFLNGNTDGGLNQIETMRKGFLHLSEGGRLVAIVPNDEKAVAFTIKDLEGQGAVLRSTVIVPNAAIDAGANGTSRIIVVDKVSKPAMRAKAGTPSVHDFSNIEKDALPTLIDALKMPERIIDKQAIAIKKIKNVLTELRKNKLFGSIDIYDENGPRARIGFSMANRLPKGANQGKYRFDALNGSGWYYTGKWFQISYADFEKVTQNNPLVKSYFWLKEMVGAPDSEFARRAEINDASQETIDAFRDMYRLYMKFIRAGFGLSEAQLQRVANGLQPEISASDIDTLNSYEELRAKFEAANHGDEERQDLYDKVAAVGEKIGLRIGAQAMDRDFLGGYNNKDNTLMVNKNRWNGLSDEKRAQTLLHEFIHSVTVYAVAGYDSNAAGMSDGLFDAAKLASDVYDQITKGAPQDVRPFTGQYSIENVKELLAEMANSETKEKLMGRKMWVIRSSRGTRVSGSVMENAEQTTAWALLNEALDGMLNNFDKDLFARFVGRLSDFVWNVDVDGRYNREADLGAADMRENGPTTDVVESETDGIKSATDNTGEFDPNNPDIRYREGQPLVERRLSDAERTATNRTLDSMGEALGVKINRVGRDGMPKGHKTAKGYFNHRTGEMTICMDNVTDGRDAIATVLHETVGHKGLRELFGAQFNEAMVRIYAALDNKGKMWVNAYMARHGLQPGDTDSIIRGMEEYMAHLAESGDFKRSVWDNIKEILGKIVDLLFGTDGFTFTDRELNYILRASYEHLKNPNWLNTPLGKAQDTLWKRELGINDTDPNRPTDPDGPGTGILYRDGETQDNALGNYEAGLARKGTAMITENQNADLPVKIGMEAVMKEVGMTELREDMDYLQRHNLASSRADTEAHDFELFRFTPMLEQVREVQSKLVGENATNEDREDAYNAIRDYLYAVSGLERNNYKNNEIEQEKKDALANADSAFKTAVDAIENNDKLSDNDKSAEIAKLEKKLAEKKKEIEEKYEAMKKDWSGLTGLTGHVETEWREAEDEARKLIKDFKRKVGDNAALNELWNRIRACTDYSLEHAYKHGLLTRDEYEKLHGTATQPRMWNYYLPLRGFAQGTAEDVYSYSTFLNPSTNSVVTRKMKGRKTEADDPLATILNIAETEIVQGNDNWAKQALLKFVQSAGNNSLLTEKEPWYVKDTVTGKWSIGIPEDDETLEHFEARMQDLREKGEAKKGRRGLKLENIMANKAHRNEHLIHVKVGGLDKMIWVNGNPALAKAVTGFGKKQSYQWIRRASRVLSNLFTTYSLDFSVKNLIRDTLYSRVALAVKEDREYRRKFSENWWKNGGVTAAPIIKIAAMWNSGELQRIPEDQRTERQQLFIDFMHDGGQTGYTIINSVNTIKRSLERSMRRAGKEIKEAEFPILGVRIPLFDDYAKLVSTLNEGFELLTRFTAYQTSRQSGRSGQRSASDAKEISVNFNRRGAQTNEGIWGHIAAFLGATHYFYNAGVQGFDNYLRLFKANTKKMTTLTAGFMVMGILTPLVNGLIASATGGGDDDWYWNIPEWVRRNNIIIGWKGTYIALPLPVEFRAPYGIGDITGSAFVWHKYANRKGGKMLPFGDLALDLLSTASNILPVNPVEGYEGSRNIGDAVLRAVAPDATMFIVDLATNRDYTGRPLWKENPFSETTPKCFGAYASTPKGIVNACQKLSELTYNRIDIAPGAVRDFMNNYGGGFFRTAEDVSKVLRPLFEDDPDRPFRWDNIPFLSGFTGHIDQDRSNSYAKDALNEYRQLSESVVAKVASQVGGKVSSSDVYDNPEAVLDMTESAFRRARIQKILNSKDYELGKMYREGMNNEYEMKQYVRGEKAGQWYKSRTVKREGVDALKNKWLKLRDEWAQMPSKTAEEKSAKALVQADVENAWHVYYDAEANLADELMKKEYGK